ncbi:MAG TPA: hypothetical protein VJP79_09750 [Nitrososphaera sp.]|nr:hypothetical protein [Nitrososphaera sp.]
MTLAEGNAHTTRLPPWRRPRKESPVMRKDADKSNESNASNNDGATLAVLSLLADDSNKGRELRPMLKTGFGGVVYDLGSGFEITYEKLRTCEKQGLLDTSGSLAFATCSKCGDHNLQTQLFCPECSSQDLLKSDLLIHYECQNTGPLAEFQSSVRTGYYCQKCKKDLKRVGIDYGNPGIGFKCRECEKVFQFPLVLSKCSAGHTSKIDEINLKSFPKYVLGGNAEGLSSLLIESRSLKGHLEKKNIGSKVLATLVGASGAHHVIPLLLSLPAAAEDEASDIAVEFVNEDANPDKSMLQLLMKSADLKELRMIVVFKGAEEAIEKMKSVVNPKRVRVLPAIGGTEDLANDILREITSW